MNILSQVTEETFHEVDIKIINGLIKRIKRNPKSGLKYINVGKDAMKLVVYCDRSLPTNKDGSSHVGYHTFMADKDNKANLIDYGRDKSRRGVRSVF